MAQPKPNKENGNVTMFPTPELPLDQSSELPSTSLKEKEARAEPPSAVDDQALTETFAALKGLLSTVEKLQKARQEVGDIKALLVCLLDGEMVSGEELEQLKSGIGGLGKLVKLYGDYQVALDRAQPARNLLDDVLKNTGSE